MSSRKNKFKLIALTAAGLVLGEFLLVTYGKVDSKSEVALLNTPVPFIDTYSSLMTPEQVRGNLGISQLELMKMLEPAEASSRRANQSKLTNTWFDVYRDDALIGFPGKVHFAFYDDRLASVVYYPKDVGDFLSRAYHVRVNPTQGGLVPTTTPSLRIAFGPNHVVWMDEKIMAILQGAD